MPVQSTPASRLPSLVSANWVASRLQAPGVTLLDCSWYLPSAGRDAAAEYQAAHIPGALWYDLDLHSDHRSSLPHMLPDAAHFVETANQLGISSTDQIVCYDASGANLSAARVWWTFRTFGHQLVGVLDGGFRAWSSATRPVQRGVVRRPRSDYGEAAIDRALIRDRADVTRIVADPDGVQIADCRPAARFRGDVDEPRAGVRRGHIAGSVNVPHTEFTDPSTGLMRTSVTLRRILADRGLDVSRQIVALCGSGTSACTLALAVEVIRESGADDVGPPVAIYDGSWSEWGAT